MQGRRMQRASYRFGSAGGTLAAKRRRVIGAWGMF